MSVKCMFYVIEVAETASGAGRVKCSAVAKGPYAEYSQYTPQGSFEITTLNENATKWFRERLGKDVELVLQDPQG